MNMTPVKLKKAANAKKHVMKVLKRAIFDIRSPIVCIRNFSAKCAEEDTLVFDTGEDWIHARDNRLSQNRQDSADSMDEI